MSASEWTCSLPGVDTTVGVAREGQLIGCVCGLQVRPQHLQSCLVGCFDSNLVREQHRRLQMLFRAAVEADNGLAEHLDPGNFKAPGPLAVSFLTTIKNELKRAVGVKKGSKDKAQAKAVKWLKSEERRQLGGLMTHWSYVTLKGHGAEMFGGSDSRYAFPGATPLELPWQTAHQALCAARNKRDEHARALDDSPMTTALIDKELAEDTSSAEQMIKEGERLLQQDDKPDANRLVARGKGPTMEVAGNDSDSGSNGPGDTPAPARGAGTPRSAELVATEPAPGYDSDFVPTSTYNQRVRHRSAQKKRLDVQEVERLEHDRVKEAARLAAEQTAQALERERQVTERVQKLDERRQLAYGRRPKWPHWRLVVSCRRPRPRPREAEPEASPLRGARPRSRVMTRRRASRMSRRRTPMRTPRRKTRKTWNLKWASSERPRDTPREPRRGRRGARPRNEPSARSVGIPTKVLVTHDGDHQAIVEGPFPVHHINLFTRS